MSKIIMMGASGAVGGETLKRLLAMSSVERITLLGRREMDGVSDPRVSQHVVDLTDPGELCRPARRP